MDIRALALQERQHRRGSLPLKKRIASCSPQASPVLQKDADSFPDSDETLAALALIQAAASGSPSSPYHHQYHHYHHHHQHQHQYQYARAAPELPLLPRMEQENDAKISLLSLHSRAFVHDVTAVTVPMSVSKDPDVDLTLDPEETSELSGSTFTTDGSDSIASSLYDECNCQGRTLRTNAPCRRYCPQGQVYCKVHQHQASSSSSSYHPQNDDATADSSRQDKRFTGQPKEVCCIATTTRGRPCAYTAVNGTSYCNLHSHHVPEKQRVHMAAKHSEARNKKKANKEQQQQHHQLLAQSEEDVGSSSFILPSPLTNMELPKKPRGRRASKLAETHAESPYFLLSMIPTDQWYGKKVSILTGPMKDQDGIVEKWSNGWVTVNVQGMGTHNRRSIELAIVKTGGVDDADDDDSVGVFKSCNKKSSGGLSSSYKSLAGRDTVSPSPHSLLDGHVPRTPRAFAAERKEHFETPSSQTFRSFVPRVTPGSAGRAFGVSDREAHAEIKVAYGSATTGRGRRPANKSVRSGLSLPHTMTGQKRRGLPPGAAPVTKKFRSVA